MIASGKSGVHVGQVIMARGPIAALPEDLGARRERFVELDDLQPGWEVGCACVPCCRHQFAVAPGLFLSMLPIWLVRCCWTKVMRLSPGWAPAW